MTYPEDKKIVMDSLKEKIESGYYPRTALEILIDRIIRPVCKRRGFA